MLLYGKLSATLLTQQWQYFIS